jgi:hypothetical protein
MRLLNADPGFVVAEIVGALAALGGDRIDRQIKRMAGLPMGPARVQAQDVAFCA